jgi:predicted RNA-binding protein
MSKGDILIVVNLEDKDVIKKAISGSKPDVVVVGNFCQFSLQNVEVNFEKNSKLTGLLPALEIIGEDEYALCVTTDRLEALDIYGSPKKFGLINVMSISGYTVTLH